MAGCMGREEFGGKVKLHEGVFKLGFMQNGVRASIYEGSMLQYHTLGGLKQ